MAKKWVPVVPIIVAVISLVGVIVASLISKSNTASPTPTPALTKPSFIDYRVHVLNDVTEEPIVFAEVTIDLISGGAPLTALTDSYGFARIIIPSDYVGKPARIVVTAADYKTFYKNIDLLKDVLPDTVELAQNGVSLTSPPTQPAPTAVITATLEAITIAGPVWTENIGEPHVYSQYPVSARQIANFSLEADVIINDTSEEYHGLMFREQPDDHQFYSFRITQAGYFAFDLWEKSEEHTFRRLIGPLTSTYILKGAGQINHLKVIANGSEFEFYINNQKVSLASDETYPTGKFGFISCTCNGSKKSSASFSNFLAYILP